MTMKKEAACMPFAHMEVDLTKQAAVLRAAIVT